MGTLGLNCMQEILVVERVECVKSLSPLLLLTSMQLLLNVPGVEEGSDVSGSEVLTSGRSGGCIGWSSVVALQWSS